jgi:hypothetical protein
LQADVFWHEYLVTISSSYDYCSSRSKRNPRLKYLDTPYDKWLEEELLPLNLPQYVFHHVSTMAKLIAENRYDRLTSDVQKLTGKPSMSVREYVTARPEVFSTAAVTV